MNNNTLPPKIRDKTLRILDETNWNICPRCLGRNFSKDIDASDNLVRGEFILKNLNTSEIGTSRHSNSVNKNIGDNNHLNIPKCFICHDIFQIINNDLIKSIQIQLKDLDIEFDTFLVGCRVDKDILQREKVIQESVNVDVENIKKEINREIGKALSIKLDKEVDFENPHIVILVDLTEYNAEPQLKVQINPLFIEGRYKKLIRGIPQTKWPCRECKGKGCPRCNYTGKMYQESVEELISPKILKEAKGSESKFHGAGREDIDVKMLGTGRPFVLEIKEPHRRKFNLKDLEEKISQSNKDKIEILNLKFTDKSRRSQIKTSSTDTYKVYRAKVSLNKEITPEDLNLIKSIKKIEQRTPKRVAHRRADLIREREVRDMEINVLTEGCLELIIECQGGLYIKELISGDDNRTNPSISSVLNAKARCVQLDVIDVHIN